MKWVSLIFCFLLVLFATSLVEAKQKRKLLGLKHISAELDIGFKKYSKDLSLYYQPMLVKKGRELKVIGFDVDNGSEGDIKVSPNKRYLETSYIIKGYLEEAGKKILHENYMCVIIDVRKCKVVEQFQSGCDGAWNANNEWVSEGRILFIGR